MLLFNTIFVSVFSLTFAAESCDLGQFTCFTEFEVTDSNKHFGDFKTKETDLDTDCDNAKKFTECYNKIPDDCSSIKLVFLFPYSQAEFITKKICDKQSPTRKLYLEQAPCFQQHQSELDSCFTTVNQAEKLRGQCNEIQKEIMCYKQKAGEKCGKDGNKLVEELYKPLQSTKSMLCNRSLSLSAVEYIVAIMAFFVFIFYNKL